LDKALYDDYLCLVASNKQEILWKEVKETTGKTRKWTTPKRVRIRPTYSATVAFSWQEDKDGTNNHSNTQQFCLYALVFAEKVAEIAILPACWLHNMLKKE